MRDIVIGLIALAIYIQCCRKFGLRKATGWAGVILMSSPVIAVGGRILEFHLRKSWDGLAFPAQAGIVLALLLIVAGAIKSFGVTSFLSGSFQMALVVSTFTLLGTLLLIFCMAIRMPPVIMFVGIPVLMYLARCWGRR